MPHLPSGKTGGSDLPSGADLLFCERRSRSGQGRPKTVYQSEKEKQLHLFEVRLKPTTYDKVKAFASEWDVYALEVAWKEWGQQQKNWPPKDANAVFLGFCKRRGEYPG